MFVESAVFPAQSIWQMDQGQGQIIDHPKVGLQFDIPANFGNEKHYKPK